MKAFVNNFNQGVDFDHLYQRDVATQYCVLFALKDRVGHEYRMSRISLVNKVQLLWYWKVSKKDRAPGERKIRNMVRELRREGALICSTGGTKGGYWIPETLPEVLYFIATELISRAMDLLVTAKRMKDAAFRKFGGQWPMWELDVGAKINEILYSQN